MNVPPPRGASLSWIPGTAVVTDIVHGSITDIIAIQFHPH